MPLKCPKCSRNNPDTAAICLYCKGSLEGAEQFEVSEDAKRLAEHFINKIGTDKKTVTEKRPGPSAKGLSRGLTGPSGHVPKKPASDKTVDRPRSPVAPFPRGKPQLQIIPGGKSTVKPKPAVDRFWVVMSPTEKLSEKEYMALAKKMDMDRFVVKQRVSSGNPWVVKRLRQPDKARELASQLRQMGLDVYSLTDSEISSTPQIMAVKKVSLVENGLTFSRESESITIAWSDATLLVKGRIRRELTGDSIAKRENPNLKNRGIRTVSSNSWEYEVVDIYPAFGRGVRLSERDTDYRELGEKRTPSSLRNLRWIIGQFEKAAGIKENDGYRRLGKVLKPVGVKGDKVAHRLGRSIEKQHEMKYMDNSEHFDEYSTLAYIHFRKLEG